MKIISISLGSLSIPLIRPFITAVRRTEAVNDIIVMIKTDTGHIGYGSAAETSAITGETHDSIIQAIQHHIAPKLVGQRIDELNHLLCLVDTALLLNTSAKAAVDMALHDLFAQYCQVPLYRLLGGHKNRLNTSMTISVKNADEMVADAVTLIQEGFKTLKIKLGLNPLEDLTRVRAIRHAVGDEITLLVDANQGWEVKEAIQIIRLFEKEKLDILFVEQPVKAIDLQGLKDIQQQVATPIIADEACFSPTDAFTIAKNEISEGINIKLMKSSGIANAKIMANIASVANMKIMMGCMLESPIGIAAAASFALSQHNIMFVDLDPIALIKENPIQGGAKLIHNEIVLSDKPGLGIEGIDYNFIVNVN